MPTIDPATILRVRASWKDLETLLPWLSRRFYDNLFTADPSLVSLFESNRRGQMEEQGHKLMQMLGYAVNELADLDALTPLLQQLGRQHVGYGVKKEHYRTVGAALIETLAEGLGDRFTPAVEQAWIAAYEVMAGIMIAASEPEATPPPS